MRNVWKNMFLCLIVAVILIIPISAMENKAKVSINSDNSQNTEFVPGEFIVKFTKDTAIRSVPISKLDEKYQVDYIEKAFTNAEDTPLDNIYIFTVPKDSDILSIANEYSSLSTVVYAEPNYIAHTCTMPNDPCFNEQWSLHNTGQTGGNPDADIDAPEAWDIETGDETIVIAIVDTGVDWNHPDLAANIWVNTDEIIDGTDTDGNGFIDDFRGWDFPNNDNDPMDDHGHGTRMAGIVGAVTDNNIGMAGVCWNCKIMCIKCITSSNSGSTSDLAAGIMYATDNHAEIISNSWGTTYSNVIKNAVEYAYSKGAVLTAAAGNDNENNKIYPAAYDSVIAVAASSSKDMKMYASNYGDWIDVAAPGWEIYTTDLDDKYSHSGFTSAACAHVAGLTGLLISQDPTLSNDEVRKIIRANVDPYDSYVYIGTGRINAYKALTRYNSQPDVPITPTGKIEGKIGRKYSYTTSATDSDNDQLYYIWDWGNGNHSEPLGPYDSGEICKIRYRWKDIGNYSVRVMVKDTKGGESYWSDPLIVSMPKNKILNRNPLFIHFLENHPHIFPLLRQILLLLG